jgi:hypothetical protein
MQIGRGKSKRQQQVTIYNNTITARYRRIAEIHVVSGGQVVGLLLVRLYTFNSEISGTHLSIPIYTPNYTIFYIMRLTLYTKYYILQI